MARRLPLRFVSTVIALATLTSLAVPTTQPARAQTTNASDSLVGESTLSGLPAVGVAVPAGDVEIGGDLLADGITHRGQLVHDTGFDGTPWVWPTGVDPDEDPKKGELDHESGGPVSPNIADVQVGAHPTDGDPDQYRFWATWDVVADHDGDRLFECGATTIGNNDGSMTSGWDRFWAGTAMSWGYTCWSDSTFVRFGYKDRWSTDTYHSWYIRLVPDLADRVVRTTGHCLAEDGTHTDVVADSAVYRTGDALPAIPAVECADGQRLDGLTVTREAVDGTSLPARTLLTWDGTRFAFPASVNLTVGQWERDTVTGLTDYELTVGGEWLAGPGEPCATTTCNWSVAGWSDSLASEVEIFGSGDLAAGTQSFTQTISGSGQLAHVTHVSAIVVAADGSSTVGTGRIEVQLSDASLDLFMAAGLAQFAGYSALIDGLTIESICTELTLMEGTHNLRGSVNDQALICNAGATTRRSKAAILRDVLSIAEDPQVAQRILDTLGALVATQFVLKDRIEPDGTTVKEWPPSQPDEEYEDDEPGPEPEPEAAAAGAAGMLPPDDPCLDQAAKDAILADSPYNDHHIATVYPGTAGWSIRFRDLLEEYGLGHLDLDDPTWNKIRIRHKGPHPLEYHDWVRRNLVRALEDAAKETDIDAREQRFRRNWQAVRNWLAADPTIVRKAYWRC